MTAINALSGNSSVESPFFGALTKSKTHALATQSSPAGTGASGDTSLSAGNLGTTFLNLLSQELQNQDPTQPMDATAMVGQMISLNQLDQLISINQNLSSATATTATGSPASPSTQQPHHAAAPSGNLPAPSTLPSLADPQPPATPTTTPLDLSAFASRFGAK